MVNILYFTISIFIFKDLLHILQLEDYSIVKCFKKLKVKTNLLVELLILLLGISGYVLHIIFDNQTIDILFICCILSTNTLNLIKNQLKNHKSKISLNITKRIKRLLFLITTIYILTQTILYISKIFINYYLFNLFLILIFIISFLFSYPIEKLVYLYYLNKAVKKLSQFKDLKIIAVTGSFGKTSTKNILYEMLSRKYNVLKSPASFNTPMGISRTILEYLKPYHEMLILEFGAKKRGEIKYLCRKFKPQYGILTSIGKQHMESFGSFENVVKTKMELQQNLSPPKFMVFNCDNRFVFDSCVEYENDCAITYVSGGLDYNLCDTDSSDKAIVRKRYIVSDLIVKDIGSVFSIGGDNRQSRHSFSCKLLGRHNISNIVCAYAMARHFKILNQDIALALRNINYVPHRLEKKEFGDKIILDNSYNSNPDSFLCSMEVLSMFSGRKRVVVTPGVVEQGSDMYRENYQIGKEIALIADEVVIVNKLNRKALKDGLVTAGFQSVNIKEVDAFRDINFNDYCNGEVVLIENDLPDNYR